MEDSFVFLAEYKLIETGSADLCGVMNHKNKLHMVILQSGVIGNLLRNIIINASLAP